MGYRDASHWFIAVMTMRRSSMPMLAIKNRLALSHSSRKRSYPFPSKWESTRSRPGKIEEIHLKRIAG